MHENKALSSMFLTKVQRRARARRLTHRLSKKQRNQPTPSNAARALDEEMPVAVSVSSLDDYEFV